MGCSGASCSRTRRRRSSSPFPPPASSDFVMTSWSLMVRWMAAYSTPFRWPKSKSCARRAPSRRP
eukprot:1694395-Alexandrium_andersonii.AAC.1